MLLRHNNPPSVDQSAEIAAVAIPRVLNSWQRAILFLLLLAGPILLIGSLVFPALNRPLPSDPAMHLLVAGVAALIEIVLSLLVLQVARRAGDSRVLLIGLTMLSSALIFLIHAIATPGIWFQNSGPATGFTARLFLMVGGIGFGLSGLSLDAQLDRWLTRNSRVLALGILLGCFALAWTLLAQPASDPASVTASGSSAAEAHDHSAASAPASSTAGLGAWLLSLDLRALLPVALAGYLFAVVQHYRFYRRDPSALGLAVVCGIALFGMALVVQTLAVGFSPLFWMYHVLEVSGVGVISASVLAAYRRGLVDETLLENLFLPGTRSRIQANYARALDELIALIASGERLTPDRRAMLRGRFGMTEGQIQVLERAAAAVAQERQQREELERLNVALRQLERDKDQLTQMVVHDLKNPLTALVGFLEILQLESLSAPQHELVEGALRSGRNLSGLIGDLLDIAQMSEGQLRLNRARLLVETLLAGSVRELRVWMAQEEKTATIVCEPGLPIVADERLVRRVLLNLISNAIKHTPPHTKISVRALPWAEMTDGVVIEVADNGPGIAPARLERIFERFVRGGDIGPTRQTSTGLGLAFCRMAVEAHGGRIEVTSAPGQGTTFRVLIPPG